MPDVIPKFKSFKPKAKSQESKPSEDSELSLDPEHRHRKRQRVSREDAESPNHRHLSEGRRRNRAESKEIARSGGNALLAGDSSRAYTIDTAGDYNNRRYGSLHKYDISEYHRQGSGNVLGLEKYFRIDRAQSTHSQVVVDLNRPGGRDPRGLSRAKSLAKLPTKTLQIRSEDSALPLGDDFVPVSSSRRRSRTSNSPEYPDKLDFRHDESQTADDSSDSELSGDPSNLDQGAEARRRNGELFRLTKDHPEDEIAWKQFIDHQKEMVAPGIELKAVTTTQRRAIADMRLDLYEKALSSVSLSARQKLVRLMLEEGSYIWDAKARTKKYQEAILQDPSNVRLWRQYIALILSSEQHSTWDKVKSRFIELSHLLQTSRKTATNADIASDLEVAHIYVILRLTRAMQDMGYEELSIATWQSLMSIHCFDSKGIDATARLTAQAQAWDDEEQRFGEPAPDSAPSTAFQFVSPMLPQQSDGRFASFARREQTMTLSREMPGKTSDEQDEDVVEDVFHVVFHADMTDILEATTIGFDQEKLTDGFLAFFGLPSVPKLHCFSSLWRDDPALSSGTQIDSCSIIGTSFAVSTDTIWNRDLFPESLKQRKGILEFINECLSQLISAKPHSLYLSVYWLAFQAAYCPEVAPKTAKRLIKARPADLALYDAAAHIEARLDRHEKAKFMSDTAMRMGVSREEGTDNTTDSRSYRLELHRLAHSSAWRDLRGGDEKRALSSLFLSRASSNSIEGDGSLSIAAQLSFTEELNSGLALYLRQGNPDAASLYASSHLLLTYLASSNPLTASLALHESHLSLLATLDSSSALSEGVHQSICPLLTYHLDAHRPHRPSDLLKTINAGLILFPSNTLFLTLQQRLTGPLSIIDVAQRSSLSLGPHSGLGQWLTAVQRQIARAALVGPEAARSLFRRATGEESGVAHAPAVWWAWLRFEAERSLPAAKRVWAAGRRGMPWSKGWVLEGLRTFDCAGGMTGEELTHVYEGMLDAGMRIRIDMGDA